MLDVVDLNRASTPVLGCLCSVVMIFFTLGIQLIPSFFFQAIGKGFPATVLSSARYVLFLLPCLLILPSFFGIVGVWISFPIADALAFLLASVWMILALKKANIPIQITLLFKR